MQEISSVFSTKIENSFPWEPPVDLESLNGKNGRTKEKKRQAF